jgi:hypothetical protein
MKPFQNAVKTKLDMYEQARPAQGSLATFTTDVPFPSQRGATPNLATMHWHMVAKMDIMHRFKESRTMGQTASANCVTRPTG